MAKARTKAHITQYFVLVLFSTSSRKADLEHTKCIPTYIQDFFLPYSVVRNVIRKLEIRFGSMTLFTPFSITQHSLLCSICNDYKDNKDLHATQF